MNIKFGGQEMHLEGSHVKVGDKAPEFKAVKNDLSEFNSEEHKGKIRIYSVVPSIDTGVCSLQTKSFNEEASKLGDNVYIITISNDLPFAQQRFCGAEGIDKSIIVSDYRDHEFGEKYGFLIKELKLLSRGVVIVDKDGKVAYVEYVNEVTHEVDFEAALNAVKELV
ncbi:thiol peroxidase [Peptoniphilus catoniae]|uniref:thiol peroxidase n=1 Tax=Peptoniphilus catoniae TaxID=1660341 RepID=UPI0010FDA734|nr:thiol peroxidase [Peptoniphilus catoniae]